MGVKRVQAGILKMKGPVLPVLSALTLKPSLLMGNVFVLMGNTWLKDFANHNVLIPSLMAFVKPARFKGADFAPQVLVVQNAWTKVDMIPCIQSVIALPALNSIKMRCAQHVMFLGANTADPTKLSHPHALNVLTPMLR